MPAQTGGKKAQAAKRPNPAPRGRSGASAAAAAEVPSGVRGKLTVAPRNIIDELRKVVWPSFDELTRMTGVVIVTVIIFAALVGGFDYLLALGVGRIYNTPTSAIGVNHVLAITTAVSR